MHFAQSTDKVCIRHRFNICNLVNRASSSKLQVLARVEGSRTSFGIFGGQKAQKLKKSPKSRSSELKVSKTQPQFTG
ncbi:unnamed protein product, partial [Linum tenue]